MVVFVSLFLMPSSRLVSFLSAAALGGPSELLKGVHSWSSEQRRYDHPAMKTMRKANSASLEAICHWRLGS